MTLFDLPFKTELMKFSGAASVLIEGDYLYEMLNKSLNKYTYLEIKKFQSEYRKELNNNPLIEGLLNLYLIGYKAETTDEIKRAYEEFYELQHQYPFNKNMKMYMDAGCTLWLDGVNDAVLVTYPLYLYQTYLDNHGIDSMDTRGGYLYPKHKLTREELLQLQKECPESISKDPDIKRFVEIITNKR